MSPDRYVPRQTGTVEAWKLTEDNIEDLARELRLTLVHRFGPRARGDVVLFITIEHPDRPTETAEPGDYLIRDESGQVSALYECSFVARYMPADVCVASS